MGYREGRFHLEFSAPAEVGALVEQALIEAKDALFQAGHPAATLGAAVEEVVTRSLLQAGQVTPSRESRYRVYLHLGTEGTGWLHQRGALPGVVVDRLTCDGVLQPVWETGGSPVDVGRAQHIVPERTRRLVQDRDRGCRYPGCLSIYHLEVHHLQHWRDGGLTDIDNLARLCGHHHDAHRDEHVSARGHTAPDEAAAVYRADRPGVAPVLGRFRPRHPTSTAHRGPGPRTHRTRPGQRRRP
ncbi:HNH endonuclease signature motif containing protein [Leekyejoonella antrihumi]|nr:HNH endonuclease signature motif containing protein [Leekyejoonella antrihumi]